MRRLRRAHQRCIREQAKRCKKFKQRAIAAGTAVAITLGAGVGLNKTLAAYTPDSHELVVSQDADADLLTNKEELAIGYRVFKPDQNRNEIPDGTELAKRCAVVIDQIPLYDPYTGDPEPNEIYKYMSFITWGWETCDVCGETIYMGGIAIVNPQLNLTHPDPNDLWHEFYPSHLSFLALHYMQHGSFSCAGSVHNSRTQVARLLRVLELQYPYDPNEHQLSVDGNDLDRDLLTDSEELKANFNLHDADQDADLSPDGVELAKQCGAIIDKLPWDYEVTDPNETYKWCDAQLGLETCDICGAEVNMGPAGIVNPKLGLSVDCPLIAIHYMEHGSFNYAGDVHGSGRIDVATLVKVLEVPRSCGDLGTIYMPSDLNRDCKIDFADFAEFADKWLDSTEPSQSGQGELAEPGMTYQIDDCEPEEVWLLAAEQASQTRFTVTVEGRYIHFEDMMVANCCPEELGLEMTVEDNLITIHETEYTPGGCWCICSYPTTATLGPFEPGTYTLDVYEDMGGFIGSTTVTIGPAG